MTTLPFNDKLSNIVAGMGTGRDKASHSVYGVPMLSPEQAANAYRGTWLAQKIIDIPPMDATRKWRAWQAKARQISAIEREESRLGIRCKVLQAWKLARLTGGAALYIGTSDSQSPEKPLDFTKVRKGDLRFVTVLGSSDLSAGELETNVMLPEYGTPKFYSLNLQGTAGTATKIHPTRLVMLSGTQHLHRDLTQTNMGWGDSVLLAIMDAITNADATAANIASLIFEAKVDVISVEGLSRMIAENGEAAERMWLNRFRLAATGKGINGMLLLDSTETYEQKSASFAQLPEVLNTFLQIVSGAADIPITRLLGQAPGGLNADGDSSMRNYHDRIQAMQELTLTPAMAMLDECLIRSALGTRPEGVFYLWNPLEQMSEAEKSEIAKRYSEAAKLDVESGLIPADALAIGRQNALVEAGTYPGLEPALAESKLAAEAENAADEPPEDADPTTALSDASPRSLYVSRKVTNTAAILAWAKAQGFETTLEADDLHVTIAYSRDAVDWLKVGSGWGGKDDGSLTIPAGGARLMEQFGEATVLVFGSSELSWRHMAIREAGASWDHPDYNPHITISYGFTGDIRKIEPYRGVIELGPEIFEEIKADWQSNVKES